MPALRPASGWSWLCAVRSGLGRAAEAVDELTERATDGPRDEELLLELQRNEAATAGPAAALARYEHYGAGWCVEELGSDPRPRDGIHRVVAAHSHRADLRRIVPLVKAANTALGPAPERDPDARDSVMAWCQA
ncbi:BTAD domain-containing putative transcriptional regulator [Amycolatopsis sp. NPDC004378]